MTSLETLLCYQNNTIECLRKKMRHRERVADKTKFIFFALQKNFFFIVSPYLFFSDGSQHRFRWIRVLVWLGWPQVVADYKATATNLAYWEWIEQRNQLVGLWRSEGEFGPNFFVVFFFSDRVVFFLLKYMMTMMTFAGKRRRRRHQLSLWFLFI